MAIAFVILWLSTILGGGSSRDTAALLFQRPVTIACLFVFLCGWRSQDWRMVRTPLLLLAALAGIMLLQLVPLPPGLWDALPGRARFAPALAIAGAATRWHPLSVAPDQTWDSLAALFLPITVLIGHAAVSPRVRALTLPALILVGLASAFLGILQLAGGEASSLYLYRLSNTGYPVGFLANRNHEAALLAVLLPALRAYTVEAEADRKGMRRLHVMAGAVAAFLVPMVFATGSRAGVGLLVVGLVAAWFVKPLRLRGDRITMRTGLLVGAGILVAGLALWAVLASGRAVAVERLFAGDAVASDPRFAFTPVTLDMLRAAFPLGWGFGTFDLVFRSFEPYRLLHLSYVNHAHDDLLELLLTGGIAAGLVLAAFLMWIAARGLAAFRVDAGRTTARPRAAFAMIAMLMLASLVDYPLRTPLIAAVFALLCAWLIEPIRSDRRVASTRRAL